MPVTNMKEQFRRWQERTRRPSLTALLVVEVLLICVAVPLRVNDLIPGAILTMMIALFLFASFFVALQSRLAMVTFAATAILSQIIAVIHGAYSSTLTAWLNAGARHAGICAVSWVIAKMVFGPGRITVHRIEAAIVLYLNIALLFFTTYLFVLAVIPDAFSGLTFEPDYSHLASDLLYFSFATMLSLGYQGIMPVGPLARALVGIESLIGLLYPAALLIWFLMLHMKQNDARP